MMKPSHLKIHVIDNFFHTVLTTFVFLAKQKQFLIMSNSLLPIVTQDDDLSHLTMVDSVNACGKPDFDNSVCPFAPHLPPLLVDSLIARDQPDFDISDFPFPPQPPPLLVDSVIACNQPDFDISDFPFTPQPPPLQPTIHPFFLGLTTEVCVATKSSSAKPISVRSHFRNGKKVHSHKRKSPANKASKTKSKNKPKIDWEKRPDTRLLILKHQLDIRDP